MASSLKRVRVAPKGMGLNDFVAMQEDFFAVEGLDVEFDWKTFRGTQSSWKDSNISSGPRTALIPKKNRTCSRALACGVRSATPAPAWAASLPKVMAIRPGQSSLGRSPKSGSQKT